MLNKIVFKNVHSIGECEIDFKKNKYGFLESNVIGDLVNPIALYGHNGSGKSSFFKGIRSLIQLLSFNVDSLSPFIVNQYRFNDFTNGKSQNKDDITGSVLLDFDIDGVSYEYFLSTTVASSIPKEYLKVKETVVFESLGGEITYRKKRYPLSFAVSPIVPALRILAGKELSDEHLQKAYGYLSHFTFVDLPLQNSNLPYVTSVLFNNVTKLDFMAQKSEEVKELLSQYDEFPLYTIKKKEKDPTLSGSAAPQYELYMDDRPDCPLPIGMISDGMRNQSLLLSILLSLPENAVLFVDEIEQALHPSAIVSFLNIVKKRKIQLVFSSHNTHILQHLRPDQVYFAKWDKGFSKYYRLSKIYPNIREVNNIEKMYLGNLFSIGDSHEA